MAAPAQSKNDFQKQAALDARAICQGECSCLGTYKPLGTDPAYAGAGATVSVIVLGSAVRPEAPGRMGPDQRSRTGHYRVQVPAMHEDELVGSAGVGSLGGVADLKGGDTLELPGWPFGRGADVVVRVGADIQLVDGAFWVGQVSL